MVKTNNLMESFITLSYILVLSNVTQKLLILSGVELNPGPAPLGKKYLMNMLIFYGNLNHLAFSIMFLSFIPKYLQILGVQKTREKVTIKLADLIVR